MAAATILDPKLDNKIEAPKMWHVMILNDDFTPFIFVIEVLVEIFKYSIEKAEAIAQEVHDRGRASAGLFPREIAETRVYQIHARAHDASQPLKALIEQAE